ncbi:MAG TPA: polysaccharide biosynthesis C-terminal domain-containing protein, partial [Puia sp.]|nr:polysaccharide biosynthesis C-terminal domain-containing protein [Puia sp.]
MSTIRKQSIISSGVVYFGFALGVVNNLLFAKWLTPAENGLVMGMFVTMGNIIYPIATVGMPSFINKFFPYYGSNLSAKNNDQMSIALFITVAASLLVVLAGVVFKPLVVRKFGHNSPLFIQFYGWVYVYGTGLSLLYVLEAFGWQLRLPVLTSFTREILLRLLNLGLIVLLFAGLIAGYDRFVKLYAFTTLLICLVLASVMVAKGKLRLVFSISRVTRRFFSKIRSLVLLAWPAGVVLNLSQYFAQLVIAAVVPGGLAAVAVFTIGQFIASIVMAPQRAVAAASIGPLSQAWREKDYGRIKRMYQRSCLSQLIFAVGIYVLIAINFRDGIGIFGLPSAYYAAEPVFLLIGLNRVIDMGTGLNTQIIGTSVHWRLDFFTGMILVSLTIPLNYWLAKHLGLVGPAIADLLTFAIYNGIRSWFLYRRYGFQPFDWRMAGALATGVILYFGLLLLLRDRHGFWWAVMRSVTFLGL